MNPCTGSAIDKKKLPEYSCELYVMIGYMKLINPPAMIENKKNDNHPRISVFCFKYSFV